jgi:hypothetical protein
MNPQLGAVASVFHPSDSDWVVSIRFRDGVIRQRRISPGTITEDQAINYALAAERKSIHAVEWLAARRASDRTIEPSGADLFLERMRRMRK